MSERPCPFPGLLPFQERDAPFFFGRDRETEELLKRLEQGRFLAVIGVSGSGKSSLVHAGINPELRFGNPAWRIVEMKPGSGPRRRLEEGLGQPVPGHSYGLVDSLRNGGERVLVIVDQFEEIFSYRKQDAEKAKEADLFVQQLLRASAEPGEPVYVLLTMRTDYLGHCALFRNLPEALNEGTYLVPRLTRQEQEEAIRSPLAVSGVEIDPEVVDLLLNEAEANRDELTVLQHLLKRLWEEWANRSKGGAAGAITRADYDNTGGWAEAIAKDAGTVLGGVTPAEREAVKRVYQRLTEKGTGERPIRTPCALAELLALTSSLTPPERLRELMEALRRRDLLVWEDPLQEDTRIDIPHECVTWRWKELEGWIEEEDRDRQRLGFIDQSRQKRTPLAGSALEEARGLQARITTTPWAGRYELDAGELTRHIEESWRTAEKARLRRRNTLIGLGLASLAFAVLGAWALFEQSSAKKGAKLALARQLAAHSERVFPGTDIELATLLATESMRRQPTFEGDRALRRELDLLPRPRWLAKHGDIVNAVAFNPDGKWVATGSDDGTARVMEAATGKEVARLKHESSVNAVAFSPDGKWVATGSSDNTARVLEAATGREVARLKHEGTVNAVAFSPDGKWVATGSDDDTARVMEAATGKEVARLKHERSVNAVAFSPDGKWVATGSSDNTARVLEAATGREVARLMHEGTVNAVAFSPDGQWVATGSGDVLGRTGEARVMEAATGREVWHLEHNDRVIAVAFSPDGRWVATGSDDGMARVLWADTGREVSRLMHEGPVDAVAFSPDGEWVATGSHDGTARVLEAFTGREVLRLKLEGPVHAVAFSPDGKWVATGSWDDTARVLEVATSREVARLKYKGIMDAVAFSPDGRWVTGSLGGTAQVIEAATGKEVSRLKLEGPVHAVAFSPDGKWVATGSGYFPYEVRVIEAATGREVWRQQQRGWLNAVAFSPDSKWVATGSVDATARVMEAATGREVSRLKHEREGPVNAVAFSPDGKWVATGSDDDTARVMEAATGKEVARLKHERSVNAVAFSPDGKWVATGSADTARVLEVATGRELYRIELAGAPLAVRFSADRRWLEIVHRVTLVTLTDNDLIYTRRTLDPQDLIREACEKLTRNLTVAEGKQYVGAEIPYERTCENRPFPADYVKKPGARRGPLPNGRGSVGQR